ncbi:MAG: hypothetical protein ABSE77_23700 [Acidimicrobiales bacterium]|jgi:hypothetical protein
MARLPWCDDCSKFWNPPQLVGAGECPTCGRSLAASTSGEPAVAPALPAGSAPTEEKVKGAPWHFKLLVVGVTVYMVYRIYWLIEWLPKHI